MSDIDDGKWEPVSRVMEWSIMVAGLVELAAATVATVWLLTLL